MAAETPRDTADALAGDGGTAASDRPRRRRSRTRAGWFDRAGQLSVAVICAACVAIGMVQLGLLRLAARPSGTPAAVAGEMAHLQTMIGLHASAARTLLWFVRPADWQSERNGLVAALTLGPADPAGWLKLANNLAAHPPENGPVWQQARQMAAATGRLEPRIRLEIALLNLWHWNALDEAARQQTLTDLAAMAPTPLFRSATGLMRTSLALLTPGQREAIRHELMVRSAPDTSDVRNLFSGLPPTPAAQ